MREKLHIYLSWNEFLVRYLENYEEFLFHYKDNKINICYGKNGSFSFNIIRDNKKIIEKSFTSPQELINEFRLDGYSLKQIWEKLY